MAYELHIEREGGIPLAEWRQALADEPNARETNSDSVAHAPDGAEIRISSSPGDAEIAAPRSLLATWLGRPQVWQYALRYTNGRVSFKPAFDIDNPRQSERRVIASLAKRLNATIVGDEGEEYDW